MSHEREPRGRPLLDTLKIVQARVHPSWRLCAAILLEGYPEIESVTFARIRIGGASIILYAMALHYRRFIPGERLRELELNLKRVFRRSDGEVIFSMIRERRDPDVRSLPELLRRKGVLLYKNHTLPS